MPLVKQFTLMTFLLWMGNFSWLSSLVPELMLRLYAYLYRLDYAVIFYYINAIQAVKWANDFPVAPRAYPRNIAVGSIDASEALKVPGVFDMVTADDVPATNGFCYSSDPEIVFARNKVICMGQIVCAVVADSDVHANQTAAKVKIEYEVLQPMILTIEEAVKHKSVFEPERKLEQGNVDQAFETPDNIIEDKLQNTFGKIHTGGQEHFYMETQSVLAVPKGEDKEMDGYVSTQHPATIQVACQTLLKQLQPIINKNPKGTWNDWNLRTDIVMDIGCSINPAVDIGQIEGAFVQGIGLYTMEELKYSPEGALYTWGPDQYEIPAVWDIPEQFSVSLLSSSRNPYVIYASKPSMQTITGPNS